MRILFDLFGAQPEGNTKFHGGGEHIKTVLNKMLDLGYGSRLGVFYNYSKFIDDWLITKLQDHMVKTYDVKSRDDIATILSNEQYDVFYSALPYAYRAYQFPNNIIKIGTFHGLRPIEVPIDKYETLYFGGKTAVRVFITGLLPNREKNRQIEYYRKSIELFDEIICVSNHTRFAISNYYPEHAHKTTVFYSPAKYVNISDATNSQPIIDGKYILLISVNRYEKNSYRALKAIDELLTRPELEEYKVVTVGNLPSKIKKRLINTHRYVSLGYIETEELENLYCHCDFFIYPTLSEGFGTPPLEAMKYGKTCCVSAVTSLTEVCGNAAYYFNPYDIDEIKNRVLMAINKKIDSQIVITHFEGIKMKQDKDLENVANFVCDRR